MNPITIIAVAAVILAFAFLLRRKLRKDAAHLAQKTEGLFEKVSLLFSSPISEPGEAAGSWTVRGHYNGHMFQLRSIIDTLATRKLPSLWLQVTLQKSQLVAATIDIMRRPNAPTTFSNFEFLPHRLQQLDGFPEDAVVRSDSSDVSNTVAAVLSRHAAAFNIPKSKELLVQRNGLRLVVQISEGDRLRHGVFRQADFGDVVIEPQLVEDCMTLLLALDHDLRNMAAHE